MTGTALTEQSVIELHPLHVGDSDGAAGQGVGYEVGRPETGTFISLPAEGVSLLSWLRAGLPLGEVRARFAARYGQAPDLEDFRAGLTACGFVDRIDGQPA